MGGDFNVTRFHGERHPCEGDFSAMEEFNQFIINSNLIELPLSNRQFTWVKSRESHIMALLDRLLLVTKSRKNFRFARSLVFLLCIRITVPFSYHASFRVLSPVLSNSKKCGFLNPIFTP